MRQEKRIIIEGPDGSGKTVLTDYLRYQFHTLEYIRNDRAANQDFIHWWPEQLDRQASPMVPIHDRFFYSELVYGPLLRGKYAIPSEMITTILWFLRSSAMLIYVRPPVDKIIVGSQINEQMEGVNDKLQLIIQEYDNVMMHEMEWYDRRFYRYDWTKEGEPKAVEQLVEEYLGLSARVGPPGIGTTPGSTTHNLVNKSPNTNIRSQNS